MKNRARFWDKAARKYAKSKIGNPEAYEYTLGRTQSYLSPTDEVLEIGCGTGSTALIHAAYVNHIVATDLSSEMLQIGREKAAAQNIQNVSFENLDIEQEPLMPGRFRVIMAHSLFHLVPNMEWFFGQVYDALPSGGMFISKTPCLGEPGMGLQGVAMRVFIPVMQCIGKAPYVRSFSSQQLRDAIKDAGFELLEYGDHPVGPPPAHYIAARKP